MKKPLLDNIVIVIDVGNYKKEYGEPVPFKAVVEDKFDHEIIVRSLAYNVLRV
jgi:hypothetical protein